eukprot:scaffold105572_cov24-Prasinocladus_malaysianus.AAC.1
MHQHAIIGMRACATASDARVWLVEALQPRIGWPGGRVIKSRPCQTNATNATSATNACAYAKASAPGWYAHNETHQIRSIEEKDISICTLPGVRT